MGIPTELHLETSLEAWNKIRDGLPLEDFYEEGIFDCSKPGVISFDELSFELVLDFALIALSEAKHLSYVRFKFGNQDRYAMYAVLVGNGRVRGIEQPEHSRKSSPSMIPAFAISYNAKSITQIADEEPCSLISQVRSQPETLHRESNVYSLLR